MSRLVEDIFPLTPLQQSVLFETLHFGRRAYVAQLRWTLLGELRMGLFERAWRTTAALFPSLRSAVAWQDVERPLQIVFRESEIAIQLHDLSVDSGLEKRASVERIAEQERETGFALGDFPLVRVAVCPLESGVHVVIVTFHHILLDGWAVSIVLETLASSYRALREGADVRVAKSPSPRNYVAWLEQQDVDAAAAGWWSSSFDGCALPFAMAADTGVPRMASGPFAEIESCIDASICRVLDSVARGCAVTPAVVCEAAWSVMLSRYAGRSDAVYYKVMSGRGAPVPGIDRMVGLLLNTLPLRQRVDRAISVAELLRRMQATHASATAHEWVPLSTIHARAGLPGGHLLASTLFVFENYPDPANARDLGGGLTVADVRFADSTQFPLTLTLARKPAGLRVRVTYSSELYQEETIQRMLGHYDQVLQQMLRDPSQPVVEVSLLGSAERQLVTAGWNPPAVDEDSDESIHDEVARQAARTPDAIAVIVGETRLTYRELDEWANQLAGWLRAQGVGPEVMVGVAAEPSVEMLVALLGVLKAGGAYVPLDPAMPPERLAFIVRDAHLTVVVGDAAGMAMVARLGGVCGLAVTDAVVQAQPRVAPPHGASGRHVAYVAYTSGSSGEPKGVVVTHRSLVNHNRAHAASLGLTASDRVLQFAPMTFDSVAEEIFPTWLTGGTVVRPPVKLLSLPEFDSVIEAAHVTVLDLPTAYWHEWVHQKDRYAIAIQPSIRLVMISGQRLQADALRAWWRVAGPHVRLINAYGPTEATIISTHVELRPSSSVDSDRDAASIGRPLPNVQVYVLDGRMEPVPIGVLGELYIGGAGVSRGYLGRAALTAAAFVPDPFGRPGSRLYRTGDRGRYRPDGTLEFAGRADNQIKLRGIRIELGEIEAAIRRHPDIRDAVVIVGADQGGEPQLIAYVALTGDTLPTAATWRSVLRTWLPENLIPAHVVPVPAFALTPHGKVDRHALPTVVDSQSLLQREYIAPNSWTAELVASIWKEVLRVETVGMDDDFFELGGHSLSGTRVVSRLRDAFRIDYQTRDLFRAPTVRALVRTIEELRESGREIAGEAKVAPRQDSPDGDGSVPLSFAQERLWFMAQLEDGAAPYQITVALKFRGSLDVDSLRATLNEIVARHEALRTRFPLAASGMPVQVVERAGSLQLSVIDVSEQPPDASRLQQMLKAEAATPFALDTAPLLRARLIRLADDEHILQLTAHHIVADGWSLSVIAREMTLLYSGFYAGKPASLATPPLQYPDFALWQRERLQGAVWDQQRQFWETYLRDATWPIKLPTDYPRPAVQVGRGSAVFVTLRTAPRTLAEICQREHVTEFMALLAAFQIVLYRYSEQERFLIGVPVANRNRPELEEIVGCFVNTLVLKSECTNTTTIRDVLEKVREAALAADANQDFPFDKLVELVQPTRTTSYTPLFQVMFGVQNTPVEELTLPGVTVEALQAAPDASAYDFSLLLRISGDAMAGAIEYSTELYREETIQRMLGHYDQVLQQMLRDPSQPVAEVSLLGAAERQLVTAGWNPPVVDDADGCIHDEVARQAAHTPDAIAAIVGETRLTYRELDEWANQLAGWLRAQGVGPEVMVGVAAEPSVEMLVALVGVLKAGGAYVPLDPAMPPERLAFIIRDAHLAVVVGDAAGMAMVARRGDVRGLAVTDAAVQAQAPVAPPHGASGRHVAYVAYTSGSSGEPKGVVVTHRSLVNHNRAHAASLGLTASDRVLQFAPMTFDSVAEEIFPTWLTGGTVVRPPVKLLSLPEFDAAIAAAHVTVLDLPTAYWHEWVYQKDRHQIPIQPSIRMVIMGGEPLQADALRAWWRVAGPQVRLINAYGPTEATIISTHAELRPSSGVDSDRDAASIGRPLPNVQVYVLDGRMEPVPIGVLGELYVGGAGVSRGYLGHATLTAAAFVPDPFGRPGSRLYRTGDRGRYRPDGTLEFAGRADNQIKLRGIRVELGEIEAAIRRHPDIRDAVVIVGADQGGEPQLIAYVALTGDTLPTAATWRSVLRTWLPENLIPAHVVPVPAFALTPHGKVDRQALPTVVDRQSLLQREYIAPRNGVERLLAHAFSEALALPSAISVGIDDNFFDLGGHSLAAVALLARVEDALGQRVPLTRFLEQATIREISASLAGTIPTAPSRCVVPIRARGTRRPLAGIHPLGGTVFCFWALAQQLHPQQPIFGLQSTGIDSEEEPLESVELIARRYLDELSECYGGLDGLQLCGWSFGGLVAYEMARQLQEMGRPVALLSLLDATAIWDASEPELTAAQSVSDVLSDASLADPPALISIASHRTLDAALQEVDDRKLLPGGLNQADLTRFVNVRMANYRAGLSYQRKPYAGNLVLFRAREGDAVSVADDTLGWGQLALGGVSVEWVPGTHQTMLERNQIGYLAQRLASYLAD